jgi:hypothetical protein
MVLIGVGWLAGFAEIRAFDGAIGFRIAMAIRVVGNQIRFLGDGFDDIGDGVLSPGLAPSAGRHEPAWRTHRFFWFLLHLLVSSIGLEVNRILPLHHFKKFDC